MNTLEMNEYTSQEKTMTHEECIKFNKKYAQLIEQDLKIIAEKEANGEELDMFEESLKKLKSPEWLLSGIHGNKDKYYQKDSDKIISSEIHTTNDVPVTVSVNSPNVRIPLSTRRFPDLNVKKFEESDLVECCNETNDNYSFLDPAINMNELKFNSKYAMFEPSQSSVNHQKFQSCIKPISNEHKDILGNNISSINKPNKLFYIYYFILEINPHEFCIVSIRTNEKSEEFKNKAIEKLTEFFDTNEVFVKNINCLGVVQDIYKHLLDVIPNRVPKRDSVYHIVNQVMILDKNISKDINQFTPINTNDTKAPTKYIVYNNISKTCKFFENIEFNLAESIQCFRELEILPCNLDGIVNNKMNELFENKIFKTFDDVKALYSSIENLEKTIKEKVESTSKSSISSEYEENRVKDFIQYNYELSGSLEPEYRMKATVLSEVLEEHLSIKSSDKLSFRNRLSKYLINLGLNKKRFSDGFYYYGIRSKALNKISRSNCTSLEELLKERDEQLKELKKSKFINI